MIWPGRVHGKLAGKGMDIVLEAFRDLWYRIGTFSIGFIGTLSMGGYGYATASLTNGEMLWLAR